MPKLTPVLFISSTKEDLIAYRAAVRDAAIQAGFRVEAMEYWAAQGKMPPYQACMKKVEECDVLVAIVAHRYGWVPADQPAPGGKSITWLEVEHALLEKIEVLAFVVDDKFAWPAEWRESYRLAQASEAGKYSASLAKEVNRNVKKLGEFKKALGGAGFRPSFTSADDLRAQAGAALREWLSRQSFAVNAPAATGDPSKYLEAFRESTRWIELRGLAVGSGRAHRFAIEDLYMPLTTVGGGERRVRLEEALQHRRLVIVGDPGSGKSTFLRKIGHGYTDGFPILIRIAESDTPRGAGGLMSWAVSKTAGPSV